MRESPIATPDEDRLERGQFIQRLGRALVTSDGAHASGVVVGITGEWGSGKSSILRMAEAHLEARYSAIVIAFDPWIISGRDDLITRLLTQIGKRLGSEKAPWARSLAKTFLDYAGGLAPIIGEAVGFGIFGKILGGVALPFRKSLDKAPDIHTLRSTLESGLEKAQVPIIVTIDEIDRLDNGEISAVAQFVRAVADFDRISYLLAYDHKRVAEALGGGNEARGAAYLEKIVQYQIPLPILVKEQLQNLLQASLSPHLPEEWEGHEYWPQLRDVVVPGVLNTPRDIKRFAGLVQALASELDEIDLVDLLGWCGLLAKAPRTVNRIRERPYLVGGPRLSLDHLHAMMGGRGENAEQAIELLLPEGERNDAVARLLGFLFPSLAPHGLGANRRPSPDRINNHRPLLHLLCHGLPLGHFSRADIVAFLVADHVNRQRILTEAMEGGLIAPFYSRLGEVYPTALGLDHVGLWRDIAAFMTDGARDWPADVTGFHELADHFEDALIGNADRVRHLAPILRDACLALIRDRDLHLVHEMVNRQIWANGCFDCQRNDRYLAFLSEEETVESARELGGLLAASVLADMDIIGRLRSSIPLHNTVRAGCWGEEHRECLTRALDRPEVLDALMLVFFPPGIMTDWESLQRIVEAPIFAQRATERRQVDGLASSLVASYDHFLEFGIRQA